MARSDAVWGIDIGNCSLKALRLRPGGEDGRVVADAFDYIEYPKILTQPGAEPSELLADALREFLSRNSLRGDRVAISVAGQTGLARFVKLPPVESKKVPDIVKFEAKQQIPFDLNDVIWDYQRMGGGLEESGFLLETEVGLFAMKRDQVFRALDPLTRAGIDVDIVQLAPLALYNFMCFDQLVDLPPPDEFDPDNPPPSTVVLSMGTDATDLVITNGFRVWQRSIPVGGNHFTKALTKELKLTFAKAEHLKRNAATAEDPKAVFQAMRPVFNDLLTEIQRSVGYFTSLDRAAQVQRILAMGNGIKLPGLRRYLAQSLGFEVARLESYNKLTGPEVLSAPAFVENQLCFPVCYGLALQGLKKSPLRTNLLPKEIAQDRLVNSKKPWAVAMAAVVLLGCTITFVGQVRGWSSVRKDKFQAAETAAKSVTQKASTYESDAKKAMDDFAKTEKVGVNVVESIEGRLRWLELLRAIDSCLPTDIVIEPVQKMLDAKVTLKKENTPLSEVLDALCRPVGVQQVSFDARGMRDAKIRPDHPVTIELPPNVTLKNALDQILAPLGLGYRIIGGNITITSLSSAISERNQLHVRAIDCQHMDSFDGWLTAMKQHGWYLERDAAEDAKLDAKGGLKVGPKAPGWLIAVTGYHYHNAEGSRGAQFVLDTLIDKLRNNTVLLPSTDPNNPAATERVPMRDLGISYPVLVNPGIMEPDWVDNPLEEAALAGHPAEGGSAAKAGPAAGRGAVAPKKAGGARGRGDQAGAEAPEPAGGTQAGVPLVRFPFVVQFIWQPQSPADREAKKKEREKETPAAETPKAKP